MTDETANTQTQGIFSTEDLEKEIEEYRNVLRKENIEKSLFDLVYFLYNRLSDENCKIIEMHIKNIRIEERQHLKAEVEKVYDKMLNEDWTPEQLLTLTHFLKRLGIKW